MTLIKKKKTTKRSELFRVGMKEESCGLAFYIVFSKYKDKLVAKRQL